MICNNSTFEGIEIAPKLFIDARRNNRRPVMVEPLGITEKMNIIISNVSEVYNIPIADIIGDVRKREFVEPRQMAICLILEHVEKVKLITVGKRFNRDHSSVIYSRDTAKDLIDTDRAIKYRYDKINQRLKDVLNIEQEAA